MEIISNIREMVSYSNKIRENGKSIGFVPTMGALHKGHLSLIKKAGNDNECVIVSIFVNPAQFDKKEDLISYPVDHVNDHELALQSGVDVVFKPDSNEMYPGGFETYVDQNGLSNRLCGIGRPGHFRGVTTVITKLFNIVKPHKAYFGEKDIQQSVIIKRLVRDLNMAVVIEILPTVRDDDGLAFSSRNRHLSNDERSDALSLSNALNDAKLLIKSGVKDSSKIIQCVTEKINAKKSARIEYVSIVHQDTLEEMRAINGQAIIAVAVWIGNARLIDNCRLEIKDSV